MYHTIVRAIVRRTWRRVSAGAHDAAVDMAAPDVHFRFLGDTVLGADLRGRDEFRAWFTRFATCLPDVRLRLVDVATRGWPWHTRIAVLLEATGTLDDGTEYRNTAMQWATLRWGRMVEDTVVEDTRTLAAALARQDPARLAALSGLVAH
jgi:ketosteroid isomerase-like protein